MDGIRMHCLNLRLIAAGSLTPVFVAGAGAIAGDFAGYTQPVRWTTGASPSDVHAADLNGDGLTDMLVINEAAATLTTLIGRGDGTFQRLADVPTVGSPRAMAVGDFTDDQRPDVAILSATGALLATHVNNGDGAFGVAQVQNLSARGDSIVTADFNDDGYGDLFVAHRDARRLTYLTGLGDGSFKVAQSFDVPHYPWCIDAGDLNGDGLPDLGIGLLSGGQTNAIRVLLNDAGAGFLAPVDSAILRQPVDLAFGDFNRDGVPDCATIDRHAGILTSIIGAGDGSFAQQRFVSVDGQPEAIVATDMNNDGIDDVVSVHSYFNRVSTLIGLGDGGFAVAVWQPLPPQAMDVAFGDFDGDGFHDIAATHAFAQSDVVTVLLNLSVPGAPAELLDVVAHTGQIIFGPVEYIERSDNTILRARSGVNPKRPGVQAIDLRVSARSTVKNAQIINLTIESQVDHYRGIQQARLFNWKTQQFDLVMQTETGLGDRINTMPAIDAGPYVGPGGAIELAIRFAVPVRTVRSFFEAYVDWVEIAIE